MQSSLSGTPHHLQIPPQPLQLLGWGLLALLLDQLVLLVLWGLNFFLLHQHAWQQLTHHLQQQAQHQPHHAA